MIKHVLIGCGSIAKGVHMPSLAILREEKLMEIVGVVDVDGKRAELLAEKYGVANWGTNWQAIVERTGAAAVSVCLPPGPNADVSVQALEKGLHVLCEKPPGRDVKDAERMASAAAAHPNLITMVGFNRRFAPLYLKAMNLADRMGRPKTFYGRFTRPSLGSSPSDTAADWITSDGAHVLDLAIATVGYPHAIGVSRALVGSGPDNVWTLQLHAAQGTAVLVFDFTAGRRVERFEISGPGYDATLELPDRGEWAQQGSEPQMWSAPQETHTESFFTNYGYLGEYRAFVAAIRGEVAPPSNGFAYAASYMHLVKEILACPTGTLLPVSRPEPSAEKSDVSLQIRETGFEATLAAGGRPVVSVWQSPEAQRRFFTQQRLSCLKEVCDLRLRAEGDPIDKDLAETDAVILGWNAPLLTPELTGRAKRLKLVIVIGASVKQVHPELLFDRGVLLCSTSDAIAQSVAEHCLMGALAGLRRLTDMDRQMHAGKWPSGPATTFSLRKFLKRGERLPGTAALKPLLRPLLRRIAPPPKRSAPSASSLSWSDLQGQTVGLIGWGHIARHFARLLKPFDCPLLVNSEAITPEELLEYSGRRASLGEVMGGARVISVHKGMTERTKGLIGANELALIRPGSVLINTARGPIIQEQALIARLRQGDIVAVLDVFNQEPLPPKHDLRRLSNVILTPHNASTTNECYRRVGEQALDLLQDWAQGRPVASLTRAKMERMT